MLVIGNDVLGLKVVTLQSGQEVGKVKDILFNTNSQKVVGFLIDEKSLLAETCYLSVDSVHSIGSDAMTISSSDLLQKGSVSAQLADAKAKSDHYFTNTHVITESGNEIGRVDDILFDSENGKIEDLVISPNIDMGEKNVAKIPFASVITLGRDNTIIKDKSSDISENVKKDSETPPPFQSEQNQQTEIKSKKDHSDEDSNSNSSQFVDSMQSHASQIMNILQRKTEKNEKINQDNANNSFQQTNSSSNQTVYTHTIKPIDLSEQEKKELESGTYATTGEINFDKVEEEKIHKKKEDERR